VVESKEGEKTEVSYMPRCLLHHPVPGRPEYVDRKQRRKKKEGFKSQSSISAFLS